MKKQLIALSILTITNAGYSENVNYKEINNNFFKAVYQKNAWGDSDTKSGPGSNLKETIIIRTILPTLLKQLDVRVLLDLPCGDFFWMKELDLSFLDLYIGGDIVEEAIIENSKRYSNEKRTFKTIDIITSNLPKSDLIFCRDCFQHLTNECIQKAVTNLKKSGSKYLLTSNFPSILENRDITGSYLKNALRTVCRNLQLPPFNFPVPIYVIDEGFLGKTLALWRIDALPSYEI